MEKNNKHQIGHKNLEMKEKMQVKGSKMGLEQCVKDEKKDLEIVKHTKHRKKDNSEIRKRQRKEGQG